MIPLGLGIYESYANTWPTDDQFYNGGGTSEETAYAYRAELTALQLAQRAGDQKAIALHSQLRWRSDQEGFLRSAVDCRTRAIPAPIASSMGSSGCTRVPGSMQSFARLMPGC